MARLPTLDMHNFPVSRHGSMKSEGSGERRADKDGRGDGQTDLGRARERLELQVGDGSGQGERREQGSAQVV